jgi:hypothetical protein
MERLMMDTECFSDKEKADFVQGWKDAGGYVGDIGSASPWCCPWLRGNGLIMEVAGTAYEMGREHWSDMEDEVNAFLGKGQKREEGKKTRSYVRIL